MQRLWIHLSFLFAVVTAWPGGLQAQVFVNASDAYNITQYNWDGHYGSGITLADWDNDGWPDLTFGATSGAIRTWRNLGGTGFEMIPLPWLSEGEIKALLWADFDNDGDDDLCVLEESGRCGFLEHNGEGGFQLVQNTKEGDSQLPQAETESGGSSFGDMDGDGDLDLHI